jgi:CRISPR-associated protein (TIGR02584 family)
MTWLIASLGTSPSVLTEAVWYLETQKELTIDHLTCVGTQESWDKASKELFVPGGAFDRLRAYLGKPAAWMTEGHGFTKVIAEARDNRDLAEAKAMDQAFRQVVRETQEDEEHDGPVIACISGGRKTMSSSLQQAMTLLARGEDWAFHVLLNLPDGINEADVIKSGFGFPGDPAYPTFANVGVDAFEVPLVRLREFAAANKIDLADEALVQHLQKAVDEAQVPPRLTLELRHLRLKDIDRPERDLRLPPQQALLLAAFILAGSPVTIQEAKVHLQEVLNHWQVMKVQEDSQAFQANFDDLSESVKWWVSGGGDPLLAPQLSKLKALLVKADPSYHIFAIRAHDRKGVKGFAELVYRQAPPLLQVSV